MQSLSGFVRPSSSTMSKAKLKVGHDDGQEQAVLPVHGDHAVGDGAAVENGVALVQQLLVVADADLERALEHEVELLPGVGRRVDGLVLQVLGILVGDPVGRGQLLAEHRREVLDDDAVLLGRGETLAAARDRVARELGRLAFEQVGQLHAERHGAFVQERKGQIDRAGFIGTVELLRDLGALRHLGGGVADDLAHLPDAFRDLYQGVGRCLCFRRHHNTFLSEHKKSSSQEFLETSCKCKPAVPLKFGRSCRSSDSSKSYPLTRADGKRLLGDWLFRLPAQKG
jgi:hypothetical protein